MKRLLSWIMVLVAAGIMACGVLSACAAESLRGYPDATAIVKSFKDNGLPIDDLVVFNQETDPNGLMGTGRGYTSKATFTDARVDRDGRQEFDDTKVNKDFGGTIEVFFDEANCIEREEFFEADAEVCGGALSMYGYRVGGAYLRLSSDLTLEQADEYARVLLRALPTAELSRSMLARDQLSRTGEDGASVVQYGCSFDPGKGWIIGKTLDVKDGEQTWYTHGTDTTHYLVVLKLDTELTDEGLAQVLGSVDGIGDNYKEEKDIEVDGTRVGSVLHLDANDGRLVRIFYYPLDAPGEETALVLLCYNSDFEHASAATEFAKTILYPEETRDQVLDGWRQLDESRAAAAAEREKAEREEAERKEAERKRLEEEEAAAAKAREEATYPEGTHVVGKDVLPGEYKLNATTDWADFRVYSRSPNSKTLAEEHFGTCNYITLERGQSIWLRHCTMTKIAHAEPTEPAKNTGKGVYKVGFDIQPGTYRFIARGSGGYYCVYSNSTVRRYVFNKDSFEGTTYWPLYEGQYLELVGADIERLDY